VPELIELLNGNDLKVDFDGEEPSETNLNNTFGDWQVNYGNLDELVNFGIENGLSYRYWCADGPEWDAQINIRRADLDQTFELIGSQEEALPIRTLLEFKTGAELFNYVKLSQEPIPDLEIVS
jgi:hypothetical protein